jgi:hypothetical protein
MTLYFFLGLSWLGEGIRVRTYKPCHKIVIVTVVLLEASKLLLEQNTSSVIEVMGWQIVELKTLSPVPSSSLNKDFVRQIHAPNHHYDKLQPE